MAKLRYRRVLLKIGGEALMGKGKGEYGIDLGIARNIAKQIASARRLGTQIGVVIGGGNIWRGELAADQGMDRATADYMGMLATVINALALQDALSREGLDARVQTAIEMREVAEPYVRARAIDHLENNRVVVFSAGTGNPFFTTDTAGALRAMEINAEVLIKATKVDGAYDSDPIDNLQAKKFDYLTYLDALNMGLRVMDSTAISLCMENSLPIVVFKLEHPGALEKLLQGEPVGTLIGERDDAGANS